MNTIRSIEIRAVDKPDDSAVAQLERCMEHPSAIAGALMADHHKGYSMPIGGVIAYRDQLSPSGVGYDIGCGNCAIKTNVTEEALAADISSLMDQIFSELSFGLGRKEGTRNWSEHRIFDDDAWQGVDEDLKAKARDQLGTIGGGNHYVNLMADEDGDVWVCNHFGSRGFGHATATKFMQAATAHDPDRFTGMDAPPILIGSDSELGQAYDEQRALASAYALAGRELVAGHVTESIVGAEVETVVNVHHNDYWLEDVAGESAFVVRKGATPLRKGDVAYIGGSMTDGAAIVKGVFEDDSTLRSAPHGAGRVMSRTRAAGKWRKGRQVRRGEVSENMMFDAVHAAGVELRGGGLDESPFVYRKLEPVLEQHPNLEVVHRLRPLGVAMAPADIRDPYKD